MGSTSTNPSATAREVLAPDLARGTPLADKSAVYWVGVRTHDESAGRPHPPMHNIDLGGITFPSWFTPWEGDGINGEAQRGQYPGAIVRLTDSQIASFKAACRKTLVRWRAREGRHAHGYLVRLIDDDDIGQAKARWGLTDDQVSKFRTKARSVQVSSGDEPVAKYLYCIKVKDVEPGSSWRPSAQIPASVLDLGVEAP